jgi:MFS family permease
MTNLGSTLARRVPLFYGWRIVGCAWLANFVTTPMNPLIFAFFIDPMSNALDISRSTLVWGFTIRQILGGLSAPVLGRVVDRYGSRWAGFFAGLVVGLVLIGFALTSNLWVLYGLFAVSGLTGFATFGGNLLTTVPVTNWFVAKRGRAVAIAATGGMIGTATMSLLAALLINTIGWRWSWATFGIVALVGILPAYGLFMRRRPEDVGLLPDGATPSSAQAASAKGGPQKAAQVEYDWTLREAVKTPILGAIVATFAITQFFLGPVLLYRVSFWNDQGISPSMIALGVAADPFTVTFAMLLFGFLAERVAVRWMGVIGGVWRGASLLPLWFGMSSAGSVFLHNVTWGIGSGANSVVQNLMFPQYFGRAHQGAIRGFTAPIMIAAGALGGPLAGYLLDAGLGFALLWQLCFWGILLPSLAFVYMTAPKRPTPAVASEPVAPSSR